MLRSEGRIICCQYCLVMLLHLRLALCAADPINVAFSVINNVQSIHKVLVYWFVVQMNWFVQYKFFI